MSPASQGSMYTVNPRKTDRINTTMIKKIFTMMALGLLLASPTLAAKASTYPDALARTGKNPIVIFIYGANYDKVSERTYDAFIKKNKIAPYVRQCTFLEMPLYQMPSDKEKKDMEKRLGNKKLPRGIRCYPCLAVVDSKGNLRGAVQSPEEMKDPEVALVALKKLVDNFYAQDKLIEKAKKAKGEKKAEFLLAASDIDLNMPSGVVGKEERKSLDDASGLGNRMEFDPLTVVEALQTKDYASANSYVRTMMAEGGYSKLQRQMIMAAYAGHLRRGGEGRTPASKERLRALYTEMRNIDPDSTYGAYAEGAIVIWVEGGKLTDDPIPTEINRVGNTSDDGNSSGSSGNTAMGSTSIPAADDDAPVAPDADAPSDADFEGDDF